MGGRSVDFAYLVRAAGDLPGSAGEAFMLKRGFTRATLARFGIGFANRLRGYQRPGVIYPYSRQLDSFGVHFIDGKEPAKVDVRGIFWPVAIWGYDWTFVTNSAFGAMAITQGIDDLPHKPGQSALALYGDGDQLVDALRSNPCTTRMIIAMENSEAGRAAAARLADDLQAIRQPFTLLDAAVAFDGAKDAAALLQRGPAFMGEAVKAMLHDEKARIRVFDG